MRCWWKTIELEDVFRSRQIIKEIEQNMCRMSCEFLRELTGQRHSSDIVSVEICFQC